MTEWEKKVLLTEKAYRDLITWAGTSAKTIVQNNYYFDTEDRAFHKRGITCRIREKDANYVATIKRHIGKKESEEQAAEVRHAFDTTLFADMGVSFQGCLKTTRTTLCFDTGVTATVDKNEYLDVIDYELEIEYSKEYEQQAKTMETVLLYVISKYGNDPVQMKSDPPNKSARFFHRKSRIAEKKA